MRCLPPLTKKTIDGRLYRRRALTEELIHTCQKLTFEELSNQALISIRKDPRYLPSEVLVFFLRQTKTHNSDNQFDMLYQILQERIKRVCPRPETNEGINIQLLDAQDFVLDDFAERVMCDRQEYEEKLDGYEVAFDRMIARRKTDAMRKMYSRDKPTTQLENDYNEEISDEVEKSLVLLNPDILSAEDDITYRFQLQRAIDTLPIDEKQVINMIFAGIPSESTELNVSTISKLLKCGPQTVRNRRNRAVKKLQEILGTEINDVN